MNKPNPLAPAVLLAVLGLAAPAAADPCGMVPPIWDPGPGQAMLDPGQLIKRVGVQKTYVFYKDGVESIVIRPGFEGKVDEFGMLIPFPSPPELRKAEDDIFQHIAKAIDPPMVDVWPWWEQRMQLRRVRDSMDEAAGLYFAKAQAGEKERVTVLKEEAVGMYEVVVLQAGSAAVLKKWMEQHGYRFPDGMEQVCDDYVKLGWCFVAVKTKVGQKSGIEPHPGMRTTHPALPGGSTFDGHVQAMGFRFKTDELVVPMRLATFNEGELHNIVYLLSDRPMRIDGISADLVTRQVPGATLVENLTRLPVRLHNIKSLDDVPPAFQAQIADMRNPAAHNGFAKDLFVSDLLAVRQGKLSLPSEELEKELLRISERLGLRGSEIDALHRQVLVKMRAGAAKQALGDLANMTLTVIDGNFPREVLAESNLSFSEYTIAMGPSEEPAETRVGLIVDPKHGRTYPVPGSKLGLPASTPVWRSQGAAMGLVVLIGGFCVLFRKRDKAQIAALLLAGGLVLATADTRPVLAEKSPKNPAIELIALLASPDTSQEAADRLVALGDVAVGPLVREMLTETDMARRGWAIACLGEMGGTFVDDLLLLVQNDARQDMLVRTWAVAARIKHADEVDALSALVNSRVTQTFPACNRPVNLRIEAWASEQGDKKLDELIQLAQKFPYHQQWVVTVIRKHVDRIASRNDPDVIEQLISLSTRVPQAQRWVNSAVLDAGKEPILRALLTSNSDQVRRQAAAFLGALQNRGEKVAQVTVAAFRFAPGAERAPWEGGALFIPNASWQKKEARKLWRHLLAWFVWAQENGRTQVRQQIVNNLRSVGLAGTAGFSANGTNRVEDQLRSWGAVVGVDTVRGMLAEQGLAETPKYKAILDGLE